jgi:cell division protease FtsH
VERHPCPSYDSDIDKSDPYGGEKDYYSLKHFKDTLRLSESIEEIAKWSTSKKKAVIVQKMDEQSIYDDVDYTKSLIFISGNLDEAYEFAKKTNEVDVDADIFNKLSMKINILDIKKALVARFKPEQIARFGNMQIIYPTLSKSSYETIIQRKVQEVIDNVKMRCNITIDIDKSIHSLIYENGVFPTQGTRPVFSTISEILESPLPPFLLNAFSKNSKRINISYEKGNIKAEINGAIIKYPYRGTIDKLRNERNKNLDSRVLNAVHEAGHAVVYAALFHSPPPQISSRPASTEINGFVWIHEICGSKEMIENKICAIVAGGSAEKIVFGKQNATWGAQDDLHEATKLAGSMVKRYGMDEFSSFIMHPQRSDIVNTDLNSANSIIESIMVKFISKAEDILKERKSLFNDTVDFLLEHKELSPEDFKKMCAKRGLRIDLKQSEEILYSDYNHQYQDFKKSSE